MFFPVIINPVGYSYHLFNYPIFDFSSIEYFRDSWNIQLVRRKVMSFDEVDVDESKSGNPTVNEGSDLDMLANSYCYYVVSYIH